MRIMDYYTIAIRQLDGTVKRHNIPLTKIKCMLYDRSKREAWIHLTTGFAGPLINIDWTNGSLQSLEERGVRVLYLDVA